MKIKVLMICTVPTEKSGIPGVIFNLMQSLNAESLEIGYVSINEPAQSFKTILAVHNIKLYVVPREISRARIYVKNLITIAKNYDIVHVHGNSATMVLEMIAAKIAGVKIRIAHCHNTSCSHRLIDKLSRPLFYKLCNGRMACGKEAGKWLFGNRHFKVLNNGIKANHFKFNPKLRESLRHQYGINNEIVVGHVGNFVRQKNHLFLLRIFYKYHQINPHSRLLLLGDGFLRKELEKILSNWGIKDKIIFAGSVTDPAPFLNAMDVIVMPSLFEGLPLTLVEEQANGLKIMCSNTITKDADLSGNVYFKSLSDDSNEWARNLNELQTSVIERLHISETTIGNIKIKNFDIDKVAEELKNYYLINFNKFNS